MHGNTNLAQNQKPKPQIINLFTNSIESKLLWLKKALLKPNRDENPETFDLLSPRSNHTDYLKKRKIKGVSYEAQRESKTKVNKQCQTSVQTEGNLIIIRYS